MRTERQEDDWIQKVVTLKRYEQPPPGYFDRLPNRILVRLEARFEENNLSLLQRWWMVFETRPAFAWGFGLAMAGLLGGGLYYSDGLNTGQTTVQAVPGQMPSQVLMANDSEVFLGGNSFINGGATLVDVNSSTNPMIQSAESLFLPQQDRTTMTLPVSWQQ